MEDAGEGHRHAGDAPLIRGEEPRKDDSNGEARALANDERRRLPLHTLEDGGLEAFGWLVSRCTGRHELGSRRLHECVVA